MAHNLKLVDFQHRNEEGGYTYYYVENDLEITGIIGFIPTSHYDVSLKEKKEKAVWAVIWRNIGDARNGLALLDALCSQYDYVGAIGINTTVAKLYKALGFALGELTHYYLLNREVSDFRIALLIKPSTNAETKKNGADLRSVESEELLNANVQGVYRPLKSGRFFVNRYLLHPFYKYKIYGIINKNETDIKAFLAVRAIDVNGSRCLRIVDVLGDLAACGCLNGALQTLMQDENAEYIDIMNYGLPEELFRRHGFLTADDDHVIPNYFEPFMRKNTLIRFAVLNKTPHPFVIFKGDSDQDRPNMISAETE